MSQPQNIRVLFVCLGNICRSPTAHGVFASLLQQHGLSQTVTVDSCGTGDWHVGQAPDRRATQEASKRGFDLAGLRARQVEAADFQRFDYIVAMDKLNLADLQDMQPAEYTGYLGLFLPFAPELIIEEVPDPYYGDGDGFSHVLDLVESASAGLLDRICCDREDLDASSAR